MDMQVFAQRLKKMRESRNVSAVELAEAIKLSSATIHRYENAEFKSIKEDKLEAIANYLEVNKSYLKGETDIKVKVDSIRDVKKDETVEIKKVIYFTQNLLENNKVTMDNKPLSQQEIMYINTSLQVLIDMLKKHKDN